MTDPCRRARACAGRDHDGHPAPAPAGGLCTACTTRLTSVLRDFPDLYVQLWQALPAVGASGERVSGSKSAPIPLRVDVEAHMANLVRALLVAEARVRSTAALSGRSRSRIRSGPNLTAAVALLTAHVTTLAALPPHPRYLTVTRNRFAWVVPYDAELLLDMHRLIRVTLGLTKLTHRQSEPCWYCEVRAVTRESGSDYVVCQSCKKAWTLKEYETLIRAWAHLIPKGTA